MNTTKLTQRDFFTAMLNTTAPLPLTKGDKTIEISAEQIKAFATERIAALDKKSSAEKKPTATQIANIALKEQMLDAMEQNMLYQASDLIKNAACCAGLSNQKVSTLLNQLVKDGKVSKTEDKRKTYFSKV